MDVETMFCAYWDGWSLQNIFILAENQNAQGDNYTENV